MKNVTCSEAQEGDNSGSSSSSSASGKGRAQFFVLRVNFQVPGSQTLTLKGEENPLPDLSGKPETVFVKELMFRSEDGRHLQSESPHLFKKTLLFPVRACLFPSLSYFLPFDCDTLVELPEPSFRFVGVPVYIDA